jgi:hypothetical protein
MTGRGWLLWIAAAAVAIWILVDPHGFAAVVGGLIDLAKGTLK